MKTCTVLNPNPMTQWKLEDWISKENKYIFKLCLFYFNVLYVIIIAVYYL